VDIWAIVAKPNLPSISVHLKQFLDVHRDIVRHCCQGSIEDNVRWDHPAQATHFGIIRLKVSS
jgi:hypothetical protein